MTFARLRAAAFAAFLLASVGALDAAPPAREPPPATSGPVDGLVSSPDNFKLLLDNGQVRVLQYTLLPGALDHWHTHPPRVGYVLSGAKIRVTEADGSHEDYDEKAGEIYWADFSALHDTYNIGTTPYVALLVEVKGAPSSTASTDEAAIRAQRDAFNAAIARGDLAGIAAVLADNAQIVTGADSLVFSGKAGELKLWSEDLAAPSRGIYVRTPDRITLSPVGAMAMEEGHWRGVDSKSPAEWASGIYVAKWRRTGGKWLVESETYMTTACAGSYCPKRN
jgi:ketosteroid isomerase-like protein/quercetin dioxygenase-like cupin family protein